MEKHQFCYGNEFTVHRADKFSIRKYLTRMYGSRYRGVTGRKFSFSFYENQPFQVLLTQIHHCIVEQSS